MEAPAFLAAFGDDAVRELQLGAEVEGIVAPSGSHEAPFVAYRGPGPRPVQAFRSPSGEVVGVLAGSVFGLDEVLADGAAGDDAAARLGHHLAALYRSHGPCLAQPLDGVFALLLVTGDRLLVARDAIGEHPLYVLETAAGVVLSDRLAPLLAQPSCSRRLHAGGVADYLATGFCPFSRTPVEGIEKVPPGTAWVFANGERRRVVPYHHVGRGKDEEGGDEEDERDQVLGIRRAVERAVALRRETDVPTGLFLSGGLDSSLVGAVVGGEHLAAAYSLSFGGRYRNELAHSDLVARHLGIPHRILTLSAMQVRDAFAHSMRVLDEPIGDPLTVPNVLMAECAVTEVAAIFNGEGGDPLFGGPKNLPMLAAEAYGAPPTPMQREERYLASYHKGYERMPQILTPDFGAAVRAETPSAELLAPVLAYPRLPSLLDRLMYVNLRLKGAAQILTKVYKAASSAGLVAHSPLFDRRLAEAAFRVPAGRKLRGSVEKWILKEAVRDLLPASIVERPKSGMLVPVHFWFRRELRRYARDTLLSRRARERGIFRPEAVGRLLRYRGGGPQERYGERIWLLLSFELWLREHRL